MIKLKLNHIAIKTSSKLVNDYIEKLLRNSSKKLTRFLILFLIPLLLCSCWDFNDIDEKAVVLSVGVDYDGTTDNYSFFCEAANFSPSSGQQTEQNKKNNIYYFSSQGMTFEDTRLYSNSSVPKPLFLGATTVVVFGKSLAEKSIEPYLHRIDGIVDYRKTLIAVVSKEAPKDLLTVKTNKAISTGSLIQENLQQIKTSGIAIYTTIGEMLSSISLGDVGYLLPYVGIQANDIRYLGLAVMKDSKLIDIINIKDTDGLLYLIADNPTLIETIPGFKNSKNIFSFNTKVEKRKIKTAYIDNIPVISIELDISSGLRYQYFVEPISKEEIKQLEASLSKKIQTDIQNIVTSSQKDFQCDIFNFVKYFKAYCPKAYKSIDWEQAYTTAKVNVKISTKITHFDLNDPNAKIKTSEGKNNEE